MHLEPVFHGKYSLSMNSFIRMMITRSSSGDGYLNSYHYLKIMK